jgi:hypothetical protein
MLKKEDIKNGTLVYDYHERIYGYIADVGNARELGHRGGSTTPDDELSYTFVNILTNVRTEGICECSHMTTNILSVATVEDIDIYFDLIESDLTVKYAKAVKRIVETNAAMNRFEKLISEKIIS